MNFIPLSREEQRRMAARRKAKEEANVRATTSSAAGEASLVVHHGLPQPIDHILEKDSVTEQLHVEVVPEHVSSIERVEPSHQEEDSHVKTSIVPEEAYPHHEVAEVPQSVQQQAPLEEQVSHLTIVSHQEHPPIHAEDPVLIKQVVTSLEVQQQEHEHHELEAAPHVEPAEPKKEDSNEKSQEGMKIVMIESQYEHPLGKDHHDIKIVESHEEQLSLSQKLAYRRTLNSNLTSNQVEQKVALTQPESSPIHYEAVEDHFTSSKVQNYRRNLPNNVVLEEPSQEVVHPPSEPHIPEEIVVQVKPEPIQVLHHNEQVAYYPQRSRATYFRNLDKNQLSQHAAAAQEKPIISEQPIQQRPLQTVSLSVHEQEAAANMVKSKLKRSLESKLQKPAPQQINIDEIIENVYPQQMQKSKRSLAPHLEQSQVSKLISIGHFQENLLMQHSTKLKRDLKTNRLVEDEPVVLEKVDVPHAEENLHLENSVKLRRDLKMNNQLPAMSEKLEVVQSEESAILSNMFKLKRDLKLDNQPVVNPVVVQQINVAHSVQDFAQDHSTKLKRQLKLNNELPVEPAPPVQVIPPPLALSIPSADEEYLEHSISKSKRLLSPSNKLVIPQEENVVVVEPPIEYIAEPIVEERIVPEPIQLQLEQPQEHLVPEMSESIKLKRNLQPQPPKVSERVPEQVQVEENLKTLDQGMTDSIKLKRNLHAPPPIPPQHVQVQDQSEQIYNGEKTVKLKRDLPTNTIPEPPQQQIYTEVIAPLPILHIDPPAQHVQIEQPRHEPPQEMAEDCKSEKSARSDITQGWDDKKQIFKLFKLPAQANVQSNIQAALPRKPINSLRFK